MRHKNDYVCISAYLPYTKSVMCTFGGMPLCMRLRSLSLRHYHNLHVPIPTQLQNVLEFLLKPEKTPFSGLQYQTCLKQRCIANVIRIVYYSASSAYRVPIIPHFLGIEIKYQRRHPLIDYPYSQLAEKQPAHRSPNFFRILQCLAASLLQGYL